MRNLPPAQQTGKSGLSPAAKEERRNNRTLDGEETYNEYLETRKKQNESVKSLSFEKFSKNIEASRKKIEQKYQTSNVEVKVRP